MKYCSKADMNFAIQVLELARLKLDKDSYSYFKVNSTINRVKMELEELIKNEVV